MEFSVTDANNLFFLKMIRFQNNCYIVFIKFVEHYNLVSLDIKALWHERAGRSYQGSHKMILLGVLLELILKKILCVTGVKRIELCT